MKFKKLLYLITLVLCFSHVEAQIVNKGTLKVNDNGVLFTKGTYNFGLATGKTTTTRTATNGVVVLSREAVLGSTESTTNVVDGFVRILPTGTTTNYKAPTSFGTFYGPIGFQTSNTASITTSFIRGNTSTVDADLADDVQSISSAEYWTINSANNARVSLYYDANSNATAILNGKTIDFLTILGYNSLTSRWEAIVSQFTAGSTLTSGSIISNATVNLSTFTFLALGSRKDLACFPAVTYSGDVNAKTWNGTSWSPNAPTIADKAIINGPLNLSASDLECFSVELNADITLAAGRTLTVVNGFTTTNAAKVVMSNLASIIQQNPTATAPNIEMTRIALQMRRYDYVFIANPINNVASFFSQILNKNNAAVANTAGVAQFGVYPNSAFDNLRTFTATGLTSEAATVSNTPIGRGLSSAVRSQAPYSTSNFLVANQPQPWAAQKENIHIKIAGQTNNGKFNLTVPPAGGFTRLGNPYPSPIFILKLWDLAPGILEETAYYWTYNTPRGNLSGSSYTNADFATFNRTGGVSAISQGPAFIPDGRILPLQSVLVKALQGGVIEVDNCVRTNATPAPQPFSDDSSTPVSKFRLNLQGSGSTFSQILIGYNASAGTLGVDNGYDSSRLIGLGSELSSLINGVRYTIQTRPGFTAQDVVPLQIDKRTNETFTISLDSAEGIFTETPILLHDKTLGVFHNLNSSSYSFTQFDETDVLRFEVVYQNSTLGNDNLQTIKAFAFIDQNQFQAQANKEISEILIYDIAGRLVETYLSVNNNTFTSSFLKAQGIYIAKIKLTDGTVVNQKVINK